MDSKHIFELVWTAAHNDPTYDIHRAKVVASMHKIPVATIMKIVNHAKRAPKEASWAGVLNSFKQ